VQHSPDRGSPFLAACRGEAVPHTPVWFMRQAGRSLPEYRKVRGPGSILDVIRDPALAAEITLQPVRRHRVDAAILYSDIMAPVHAIGFGVDIRAGVGPVVDQPFRSEADLRRLRDLHPEEDSPWVAETVAILKRELDVPLIGFVGAPFTVASYLIEGGPSREHLETKKLMYRDPGLWRALLERLADLALTSAIDQVNAGADAVQIFDSWAGSLSPEDYRIHVFPAVERIFAGTAGLGVPRIHFGVGTGELLDQMAGVGADVVGVDWRVPLRRAAARIGAGVSLQGNLDPAVCLAPWGVVEQKAREVLAGAPDDRGYVFNLGHGVLPETDPGVLTALVDLVHGESGGT
jgi:uroporphyrinogen decarboxylase